MTDPYRPVAARFPRERLLRAGLDEQVVGNLVDRFDTMSAQARADLTRWVDGHTDAAIAERFAGGLDATEVPTREQLDELHVPELRDRLAARGLPVSGVKGELLDRLLASYTAPPAQPQEDASVTTEQPEAGTALTGDAEQPQAGAVQTADGTVHEGEVPASAAVEPAPVDEAPTGPTAEAAAEPAQGEPAAGVPATPTAAPQPAAQPAAEPTPATLPAGSPGAPAATDPAPAATPTPAADPAGGPTDTSGATS